MRYVICDLWSAGSDQLPGIYFAPPQTRAFFDGRLDDNNMKDVTIEMIHFASLRPCDFALNRERERRKDARDAKERKS